MSQHPWISVRVVPSGSAAVASAAMFDAGSQGVLEDGAALVSHFPTRADADAAAAAVRRVDPGAEITFGEVPPIDWTEAWKDHVRAFECGVLTVAPPWLMEGRDPARTIIITPGMAFGTGDHPTTRGVLRLLPAVIRAGDVVADLGAGSAVLAIGAVKLGAARVAAIEMDPEAIADAEENARVNGVAHAVTVIQADANLALPLVAPVRVIIANIISSVLVELLPAMRDALPADGVAVLSGILYEERESLLQVLAAEGWQVTAEDVERPWWSCRIERAS
ncbi:MAG: 50S ribosomal protein L11 methyltransferase [Gemmatimonadaceae bacterium]|nr:50S ribosomal protein L11 methyltransferase [Gemmatimonadaceae bacterium]